MGSRRTRLRGVKGFEITAPGGPDVLGVADVPIPSPGPREVLVEVVTAGVNRADLLQRKGFYPPPPGASPILGLECSGRVAAVGDDTSLWSVGDEVCALLSGGGYAQFVAVPEGQVMPVPPGVSLQDAAALPEVAATVYSNLHVVAGLRSGEWLLVHGGASGIGSFALQWARAIGVRTVTTVGSQEKVLRCQELGADEAVNYRTEDFVERVRDVTHGHGVDVILDIIGAKYLERNVASLATGGRLVVIGMQGGVRGEIDLAALLRARGSIMATSLRARSAQEKQEICEALVREVWPLIAEGRVAPVVHAVLPWFDAAQAHRLLESSTHVGKVLLDFTA